MGHRIIVRKNTRWNNLSCSITKWINIHFIQIFIHIAGVCHLWTIVSSATWTWRPKRVCGRNLCSPAPAPNTCRGWFTVHCCSHCVLNIHVIRASASASAEYAKPLFNIYSEMCYMSNPSVFPTTFPLTNFKNIHLSLQRMCHASHAYWRKVPIRPFGVHCLSVCVIPYRP